MTDSEVPRLVNVDGEFFRKDLYKEVAACMDDIVQETPGKQGYLGRVNIQKEA